jgi:hypothetical protein
MSNKGRSNAAKRRRHAKAMAKRKAEKERIKAEYQSKIQIGTNSRRKQIAKRKGGNKLVADHKTSTYKDYVPPSFYWRDFWGAA